MSQLSGKYSNQYDNTMMEEVICVMWEKVIGAVVVAVATEVAREIINENK